MAPPGALSGGAPLSCGEGQYASRTGCFTPPIEVACTSCLANFIGSDFHPGLPRVGPSRARKLVLPLANPGASLASLVEDETLHAGLRLAASQFGDWVVCLNDGVVGGLLAGLQRDIIAVVASSVTAPVVNWEATAAALYINRGSTRAIVDILRLMGKEKGTNAFGQGIVVVD